MHVIGLLLGSCTWLLERCSVLAGSKRASAFWSWARRNTTEGEGYGTQKGTEQGRRRAPQAHVRHGRLLELD